MYDRKPFASGINLNLPAIAKNATARIAEFDVRTGSPATPAGTLSGGNQQKVILAREVGREHKVLIASQPTRGLDVGSIEFVHRRIVEQRDHGVAVVIVSSELDEIYALADRIAVMYEGKITGFRAPDVPAAELGRLMAGGADARGVPGATVDAARPCTAALDDIEPTAQEDSADNARPPGGRRTTSPPEAGAVRDAASRGGNGAAGRAAAARSGPSPGRLLEGNTVTVTVLALLTAIVLGGLLAAFTNTTVLHAWRTPRAGRMRSRGRGTSRRAPTWRCSRGRCSTRTRSRRCSSRPRCPPRSTTGTCPPCSTRCRRPPCRRRR